MRCVASFFLVSDPVILAFWNSNSIIVFLLRTVVDVKDAIIADKRDTELDNIFTWNTSPQIRVSALDVVAHVGIVHGQHSLYIIRFYENNFI